MVKPTNSVSEPESEIIKKIAAEREYFISVLVKFAETDTLLYLPGRFRRRYIERCGGGN